VRATKATDRRTRVEAAAVESLATTSNPPQISPTNGKAPTMISTIDVRFVQ
jgi:hypothetical protein